MHLDATNAEARHLRHLFINGRDAIQRDAKFALALAGGDVSMRMRLDVGFTRKAIGAMTPLAPAIRLIVSSSASLSTLKLKTFCSSAYSISSFDFPTPANAQRFRVATGFEHAIQFTA